MIPEIPPYTLKHKPTTVEIYQYDRRPLNGRHILLLVHGLDSEYRRLCRWGAVTEYLNRDRAFQDQYKIYLIRYNTKAGLAQLREQFKPVIRDLSAANGDPGISVVTISIGGNVVCGAMDNPVVEKVVTQVITIGTPYHGSPLFNPDWMLYSILKHHRLPQNRIGRYFAYKIYFAFHHNLIQDYGWDNSDGQMPELANYHFHFPIACRGEIRAPKREVAVSGQTDQINRKCRAYAGYIVTRSGDRPMIEFVRWPFSFVGTTLPAYFGHNHPMLRLLNDEIANIVPANPGGQKRVYDLNDGITPVFSSLSLTTTRSTLSSPKEMFRGTSTAADQIDEIRSCIGVGHGRLFANFDHVSFLDRPRLKSRTAYVQDKLSPGEGSRPILGWLLRDLLDEDKQELATSPEATPINNGADSPSAPSTRTDAQEHSKEP